MPRYHVERSTEIARSPQEVFAAVADYSTWSTWSPWLIAEPDAEVTISEDASSVGSSYAWKGDVTGQGEMEHKRLEPGEMIDDEIRFIKPFKSVAQVKFELEPVGDGTRLTWHMNGAMPFFLFWMIPMIRVFVGMDYERGLRMLKEWLETGKILSKCNFNGVQSAGPLRVAGIRKTCEMKDLGPSMESAIAEATEKLKAAGVSTDGESISVYHDFNMKAQIMDYTSGFIIPESATVPEGMSVWSTPETQAFCVEHVGSYEHLGNAWSAANQIMRYKKMKQSKIGTFEIYRNCAQETDPADLRTDIYLPLKS